MAYRVADPAMISIDSAEPERLMQQTVSSNYFRVLGIQPVAGQLISPKDDKEPGQSAVAVISYRLWRRRFNRSERAIGSKLQLEDHAFEIIGVAPAAFFGVEVGKMVDVWTPVAMAAVGNLRNNPMFSVRIMGRLHPGVTIAQAAAPMQAVMNETMLEDVRQHAPAGTPKQVIDRFLAGMRIKGVPAGGGISYLRRQYQQPLQIMTFLVGLVLLIACSNVANLLDPAAAHHREPSPCSGIHGCRSVVGSLVDTYLSPAAYSVRRAGKTGHGNRFATAHIYIVSIGPDSADLWFTASTSAGRYGHVYSS
jgi:hypothetical protein